DMPPAALRPDMPPAALRPNMPPTALRPDMPPTDSLLKRSGTRPQSTIDNRKSTIDNPLSPALE
ncbi:MAG: hypothetical protein ACE5EX_06890, partial [Phycisphaerae bacterium]